MRTIKLSKSEAAYLTDAGFLPEDLVQVVSTAGAGAAAAQMLELDPDTAERLRDELTARLARVGFGADYEPTHEGKLLEDLIDRFQG